MKNRMAKKIRTVDEQIARLRAYNIVAGSLHLLQAVVFAIIPTMLTKQVTFAVTADYLPPPPRAWPSRRSGSRCSM